MEASRNLLDEYSKEGLIAILSSVGDGILICDLDSNIKFANKKACEILAFSFDEIVQMSLNQAIKIYNDDWREIDYLYDYEMKSVSVNKGLRRNSFIVTCDGIKKYISANFTNIDLKHNSAEGYVLVLRDITRLHMTEIQIINEKNKLQRMFEGLPIGMLTLDRSLVVYQMNQAFIELFEIKERGATGKLLGDIIYCANSLENNCGTSKNCMFCKFKKELNKLIDDENNLTNVLTEISYNGESGLKSKWIKLNFMPMKEDDKILYTITVEDFTERIMYEKKLDAARKSSLSMLDSLPVMIFKINKRKKCDFVNQTFSNTFDVNQDDFFDLMKNNMNSESYEIFTQSLKNSVLNESSFHAELKIRNRKTNHRYMLLVGKPYFNFNGDFDGIIGLFLDIHDAKMSELKYRQSQKKYYSLFQNMDSVIVYFNLIYNDHHGVKDASILELNKSAYQLLKIKLSSLVGKRLTQLQFLTHQEILALLKIFEKVAADGISEHIDEFYLSSYDKWLQFSIYSPEKDFIAMLITDIDFKKKAQLELLLEKEKSEEANRVKSEFLANMSHEIRTPLNGIVGMIDLTLLDEVSSDQLDNLTTAKECVASLIDIINDVLDFSKVEAGKLKIEFDPFNLKYLIESVIKLHLPRINEQRLELVTEFDPLIEDYYQGDAKRIKQVLNNLVNNAIKFTEKGTITIKVFKEESSRLQKRMIKFVVADTGIGIASEKKALLFNSFTQLDGTYTRKYGGTGLGLVISKQLVEMMGGTIGFDSTQGSGSKFYFTLPLEKINNPLEEMNDEQDEVRTFTKKKILLVEDDRVNQIVMKKMMEFEGVTVELADNGEEAYALAKEIEYDLILMDIQMPVMDGIEATKLIRNSLNKNTCTPIVALTAFALKGDEVIFRASGMDDYISKPVNRTQLVKLLSHHFDSVVNPNEMRLLLEKNVYIDDVDDLISKRIKGRDQFESDINLEQKETIELLMSRLAQMKVSLEQENYVLLEIAAHQLKNTFEDLNAEELKNITFKMELEIRKENYVKTLEFLERIMTILNLLYTKF